MAVSHMFTGITSEGGLLPSDFLAALGDPKSGIEGLDPVTYRLAPGERLGDQVNRSWNRLKGCWVNFQRAIMTKQPGEPTTTETRERWLYPLFQELDFGRLTAARPIEIDGKSYPVSHGWGPVPIHLVGTHVDLDHRTPGAVGAAKASPHSLVQQVINASDDHLWGIISNGFTFRLVRDNVTLTRIAYVEWDLQTIFEGDLYPEFFLLWLVCHQSRFEAPADGRPDQCWLEKWKKQAVEKGLRALENLRPGVEKAIAALGAGLVSHKANQALRSSLSAGQLSTQDFYRQILRVVYRMLFLFVAEDRGLLHPPLPGEDSGKVAMEAALKARRRYQEFYSIARLRDLTPHRAGTPHPDLWSVFNLVSRWLGADNGCPELVLPALGSFLWSPEATPDLNTCMVSNRHFLEAVHALAFVREGKVRRTIDYKNMGSEELGSVYESLLEQHPVVNADAGTFDLQTAAGHERKTSGSYYTPDSLVQCLLDSALEPVMKERLREAQRLASREVANRGREIYASKFVSGPQGLARRDATGSRLLPTYERLSEGGDVRDDISNPKGIGSDSSQYRGGMGARRNEGIHSIPQDSPGQSQRTGNPPHSQLPGRAGEGTPNSSHADLVHGSGENDSFPDWFFTAQAVWERELANREIASKGNNRGSNPPYLPIPYSLLAEQALLSLRICDPAVGSGHFLIAAAHRMARRVAAARTGEEEPSPKATRSALRDVIGRCLYGVDVNPMAAELCKVNLWVEALEPGKPLSFLDHHIRVGNSLLGATPELIAKGIPDEAFKPIEGDDKKACSALKKRNAAERRGIGGLFVAEDTANQAALRRSAFALEAIKDDTPDEVRKKAEAFEESQQSYGYVAAKGVADAWCAAFVIPKAFKPGTTSALGITQDHVTDLCKGNPLPTDLHLQAQRLSCEYRFFHWHLAFPEVFTSGGFDCVLGNPPWERVKLQEKEWFAERSPEIANAPNAAARKRLIESLKGCDPNLYQQFLEDLRKAEGESSFLRHSGLYPLCGRGDINFYAVFTERMRNLLNSSGRVGLVLPTGIATDDSNKFFIQQLVSSKSIVSFFDFTNRGYLFPGTESTFCFCLFTFSISPQSIFRVAAQLWQVEDLGEEGHTYTLSQDDILRINPNTANLPIFHSTKDAVLNKLIYERIPIFVNEAQATSNPWGVSFLRMFDMTNDAGYFCTKRQLTDKQCVIRGSAFCGDSESYLPLYEAKLAAMFNHRAATFEGLPESEIYGTRAATAKPTEVRLSDPEWAVVPRYWVSEQSVVDRTPEFWRFSWFIGFRNAISAVADARTVTFTIFPKWGAGNSLPLILPSGTSALTCLLVANFNAFVLDYVAKQKASGGNLNFYIVKQLPLLPPNNYLVSTHWLGGTQSLRDWLLLRLLELTYTAWDLEPFAEDCGWLGPPFRWNEDRRFLLRCELDAAFFHVYLPATVDGQWKPARVAEGAVRDETPEELAELKRHFPTPRDAVAYIMDTFPIVRRKDEEKHGDYRTKRVILEIYDEMAEAIRTGVPYKTCVDPQPGPPIDAQGTFSSMYHLDLVNWPVHIHPPHPAWEESVLSAWFGICQKKWKYLEDDQVFPWDGREAFAYALIPYLVQEEPGKKFEFYRDAALLASRPNRCETLLLSAEVRNEYRRAMESLDWLQFPEGYRFRPKRVRETLQSRQIIQTDAKSGTTTVQTAVNLPPLPTELKPILPLILKAAENLDKLQRGALKDAEVARITVTAVEIDHEMKRLMAA